MSVATKNTPKYGKPVMMPPDLSASKTGPARMTAPAATPAPNQGATKTPSADQQFRSPAANSSTSIGSSGGVYSSGSAPKNSPLKLSGMMGSKNPSVSAKSPAKPAESAALEKHLIQTGRASDPASGKKGPDLGKREEYSKKILEGMEKTTNDRKASGDLKGAPAHPVSAHGASTTDQQQATRVLTGYRPDHPNTGPVQSTKDLRGNSSVGDLKGLPIPAKTGKEGSPATARFTSNTAQLHAVEDATAQATLHKSQNPGVQGDRTVLTVGPQKQAALKSGETHQFGALPEKSGSGYVLGTGAPGIKGGKPLTEGQVEGRYNALQKTGDELRSAQVVLDKDPRGGYTVQTSYPVDSAKYPSGMKVGSDPSSAKSVALPTQAAL